MYRGVPILNGTVPFFVSLSRCPLENLRDAKMSRFQKVDEKNIENKRSLTKYRFYYILFLMCACVCMVVWRYWPRMAFRYDNETIIKYKNNCCRDALTWINIKKWRSGIQIHRICGASSDTSVSVLLRQQFKPHHFSKNCWVYSLLARHECTSRTNFFINE